MSLSTKKCWYSTNYLHLLKRAVPLLGHGRSNQNFDNLKSKSFNQNIDEQNGQVNGTTCFYTVV